MKDIENIPVSEMFDVKKREFRFMVEDKLNNKIAMNRHTEAEKYTNNYLEALSIAENIYGVTVTQEEVTKYIDENIASIVTKEKIAYAEALGLTLHELDYIFDRDIYVMDTLWSKMIPVLMEKYPQKEGEDDNAYLERIKNEFYSHKVK